MRKKYCSTDFLRVIINETIICYFSRSKGSDSLLLKIVVGLLMKTIDPVVVISSIEGRYRVCKKAIQNYTSL